MRTRSWIVGMVLAGFVVSAASGGGLEKKLVNFGWDMHTPSRLAGKIDKLQHLPFDGLTITTAGAGFCYPFYNKNVDAAAVEARVETMSKIKWGKFTDNFMYLTTADNVDWFDEAAWADDGYILTNVRAVARIGQAGGCKGILFEPEFVYWGQTKGDPWKYQTQASREEKTIAEYRAMVRKRGVQFIDAIEEHMPDTTFLTVFWGIRYSPVAKIAKATDPKMVDKIVAEAPGYGLIHDFMLGVLEGAGKGTTIVDGNESSYYTWNEAGYMGAYHFVHQTMLGAIPEELRYKYCAQVRMGHAVYADVHSNTRGQAYPSTFMTPDERGLGMEWVVYHALKNSDRYVWFYTEKPGYLENRLIAPEMPPAIDRARRKVAANEEIGFDFVPIRERTDKAYNQAWSGAVEPSKAEIVRAVTTPKIDGKLDDEIWKNASQLGPFVNFRTATHPLETKTMGHMAYDNTNLYIGVRCEDPAMDKIRVGDIQNDEDEIIAAGSLIQVAIATDEQASKYYYICVAYDNQRWDALTARGDYPDEINGKNSSWDGEYEHATHVDKTFWSVEMAIPWATLNRQAPKAGDQIKGNLRLCAGNREPQHQGEYSSWSLMIRRRNIEAKSLGTWEFK